VVCRQIAQGVAKGLTDINRLRFVSGCKCVIVRIM